MVKTWDFERFRLWLKMAYLARLGNFEAKLDSNSYKKSGKIGEELNSWINSGSLAKITSGAHGSLILSLLGAHLR